MRIKVPKKDGSGHVIRDTRARTEVILRSLAFAHSKGIQRAWIDQERTHQDDGEDCKFLVATMYRIYRQATLTLAVLGKHIESSDDAEGIVELMRLGAPDACVYKVASLGTNGLDEPGLHRKKSAQILITWYT